MGIDLYHVNEQGESCGTERFANIGGFYNVAHLMGYLIDPMRETLVNAPMGGREAVDWFNQYIAENRAAADQGFRQYCAFTKVAAQKVLERSPNEDLNYMMVNPDDFNPDVRAFFGRMIFVDGKLDPQQAGDAALFMRGMLGAFRSVIMQYQKNGQDDVAEALSHAFDRLQALVHFCETAYEKKFSVVFHA